MNKRRIRVIRIRNCWNCKGRGYIVCEDSWDRDNGKFCDVCNRTGKLATSYLRAAPKSRKCKCRNGKNECCDVCTGWNKAVKNGTLKDKV
jgi:hypothetical protein